MSSAHVTSSSAKGWSYGGWEQPIAGGKYEFRTLLPGVFAHTVHPNLDNTPLPDDPDPETRERLIAALCDWSFTSLTLSPVEVYHCACLIFESILNIPELHDLAIMEEIRHFLHTLRFLYPNNPYHNFAHAVDVLQAVYAFLEPEVVPPLRLLKGSQATLWTDAQGTATRPGPAMPWRPTPLLHGDPFFSLRPIEILAFLLAAVGHDVGHPGLTAPFLANARAPITALVHGSPLEALHCTLLAQTLRAHGLGLVLSDPDAEELLRSVIMATDMRLHGYHMAHFNAEFSTTNIPKGNRERYQNKVRICQALLHAADISNPVRPFPSGVRWSCALIEEWTNQAKIETSLKLPLTQRVWPMLRSVEYQLKQAAGQARFMIDFTLPLFQILQRILPKMTYFVQLGLENRQRWQIRESHLVPLAAAAPLPDDDFPYPDAD